MGARTVFCSLLASCLIVSAVFAHPGSGIVADRQGQVYFVDTGKGVWRIGTQGRLTPFGGPPFHWMTIDLETRFAKTRLPSSPAAEVRHVALDPRLILSSDFPLTVGQDGALYYPELGRDQRLQVIRFTPSGTRTVLATLPPATESGALRWLNGMATSPDGSIYYAENKSVRKITSQGTIATVAGDIKVPDCAPIPGIGRELVPYLRDLEVAGDGTIFVAATGCGALLKISPRGDITVVLRTSSPWSPTAVALAGDTVVVLEYLHVADSEDRADWLPRVRKLSSDGIVRTLATVQRP